MIWHYWFPAYALLCGCDEPLPIQQNHACHDQAIAVGNNWNAASTVVCAYSEARARFHDGIVICECPGGDQ